MSAEEGANLSPPLAVGEFLRQPLPIEFGHIAAQTAKQVISQEFEAVIRREEMIPRENLRQGDRVRAISLMCVKKRGRRSFCRAP